MLITVEHWIEGLLVSLLIGHLVVAWFHKRYREMMRLPVVDESETKGLPNHVMGFVERLVFMIFTAISESAAPAAMGGWLALKMAANWLRPSIGVKAGTTEERREQAELAYRRRAIFALVSGLLSMAFAFLGGIIAGGERWSFSILCSYFFQAPSELCVG